MLNPALYITYHSVIEVNNNNTKNEGFALISFQMGLTTDHVDMTQCCLTHRQTFDTL